MLKTCLYDGGVMNVKDLMRNNKTDAQLTDALMAALKTRAKDGWEAERNRIKEKGVHESMATIGG